MAIIGSFRFDIARFKNKPGHFTSLSKLSFVFVSILMTLLKYYHAAVFAAPERIYTTETCAAAARQRCLFSNKVYHSYKIFFSLMFYVTIVCTVY